MTGCLRVFCWLSGLSFQKKREIAFWTAGIIGCFAILFTAGPKISTPEAAPDFKPQYILANISDQDPKTHLVTITLRIYNAGSPSIVRDWDLTVLGADKQSLHAQHSEDQPTLTVTGSTQAVFDRKDSVLLKTRNSPIASGGMQEGHVIFVISDVNRDYLTAAGTSYNLSFKDVRDKTYNLSFAWPIPSRQ
jgi:hypothetical protein